MRPRITCVRVERVGGHDLLHVWNRGAKAGVLTLQAGDGAALADKLLPASAWYDDDEGENVMRCTKCNGTIHTTDEHEGIAC